MEAKHWLRCYLMIPIQHEARQVKGAAVEAGFSPAELRAAKKELRVQVRNNGHRGHPPDEWFWSLPEGTP